MKGCLIALGVGVLLVIIAIALTFPRILGAQSEAADFANAVAIDALKSDNLDALYDNGSIAFRANFTDATRTQLQDYLATNFGAFDTMTQDITCPSLQMGTSTGRGKYRDAGCVGTAQFEKSAAEIEIGLVTEDDAWKVHQFNISKHFGVAPSSP